MAGKVGKGVVEIEVGVGEWGRVRVSPLLSVFSFFSPLSFCFLFASRLGKWAVGVCDSY